MKLHLACGTVYLDGYINIDLEHANSYLAQNHPELKEANLTTKDKYYKNNVTRSDFLSGVYHDNAIVCDFFSDVRNLKVNDSTCEEILAVQLFEHFSFPEGKELLKYWVTKLMPGGMIHIDIPDLEGTIDVWNQGDQEWATRLLYGSQKNEYGIHKAMYTKKTIKTLFEEVGLINIKIDNEIEHTYPAFSIKGFKPRVKRKS